MLYKLDGRQEACFQQKMGLQVVSVPDDKAAIPVIHGTAGVEVVKWTTDAILTDRTGDVLRYTFPRTSDSISSFVVKCDWGKCERAVISIENSPQKHDASQFDEMLHVGIVNKLYDDVSIEIIISPESNMHEVSPTLSYTSYMFSRELRHLLCSRCAGDVGVDMRLLFQAQHEL